MRGPFLIALIFVAILEFGQHAEADVVIDIIESGGDVRATLSGDIDLNATLGQSGNSVGGFDGYAPRVGALSFSIGTSDLYRMDVQWTAFGLGPQGLWDTQGGDVWYMFTNPLLGLPAGYNSGANLSSTATKLNTSFSLLGFTPGSYVTTLTNGNFTDSITVNIGQSIPEPSTASLIGLIGLAAVTRRRSRAL